MENRLDIVIKEKFGYSREYAKNIILKGYVLVNGKVITKPSFKILHNDNLFLDEKATPQYVSRGGFKLEKAIQYFNLNIKDNICLDIGASTGGFTDCMLKYGANLVYAVDVGTNQLVDKILNNKKVISIENMDIRDFIPPQKFDFISSDVSFISLKKIIPKITDIITEQGSCIFLIKPQFEVGRENIKKDGVVKNKNLHIQILEDITNFCEKNNLFIKDITYSPIKGGKGNIEYLAYATKKQSNKTFPFKKIVFDAFNSLK